ncbi:cyclic-di-AMP-binding protein CbpB [Virgibacillus senegalensis]|uniref:cyclic-di-AMP-binding protein CbpB n=1 Tax=Virgibacillus senegalensis TaxID=1499679 RepID=UPI00069D3E43|nr:cyclic-di-AMP-binding protein CbpB [Virgibacillus senegalensis]
MSSTQNKNMTNMVVEDLMIPAEKVAHVQMGNPLEHALLVLVKSGYSAVPVLDASFKLQGTIGKTIILNGILGLERFEMEKLSVATVHEVMNTDIPCLSKEDDFLTALKAVIDYPFVCVADQQGYFDGIVTRRAILKQLNKNLHASKYSTETEMITEKI